MPRRLCDKNETMYVCLGWAGGGTQPVFMHVFMFRLGYGLVTACEWE